MKILLVIALTVLNLGAVPITDLVNTGFGLGDAAADPNWEILSPSQQAITINAANIPGSWLANTTDSRWIWQQANGQPTNVTRTFRITFDLTGFAPSTASIIGRWSTDNTGLDILINGVSTGQASPGFTAWTDFSVNSGFVNGVNTLDFQVNDFGVISGFRAEFLSSDVQPSGVPEPSTLALGTLGFGAFLLVRRRISR